MKSVKTSRRPRARTIAIYTAGAASLTAAVVASSLLMSGCSPCKNKPEGCPTPAPAPKPVAITLTPGAGTYDGKQMVSISAPDALAIYFSTDGTTPGAANCTAWDGNPIPINDSTVLKVFASANGTTFLANAISAEFKLNNSTYTNRTALNTWLQLEKSALAALYCANNDCKVPKIDFLTTEQHWTADCPDGGTVLFDNDPYSYQSVFTYMGCSGNGITADGAVTLTLDATKLPAISIDGTGGVIVSAAGYTANIVDKTLRKYTLLGTESARNGSYAVSCEGTGCASTDINYYYGLANSLWIKDPEVNNTCH